MAIRTFNEIRDAQHAIARKRDSMVKKELAQNANKAVRSYAMHTPDKVQARKVGRRGDSV